MAQDDPPPTTLVDQDPPAGGAPAAPTPRTTIVTELRTTIVSAAGTTVVSDGEASLDDIPPEVFERFPVTSGSVAGSEAVVLLARDPTYGSVAVKVYRRDMIPSQDLVRLLSQARSEHLVRLFEASSIGGRWVEVLERIDHGTLADLTASGRPSNDLLTLIITELCEAIDHLHSLGLVHRDIKPGNVMVRTRDPLDLVLADFGLAAFASDAIDLRAQSRTIHYCSPETNSGVPPRPPADWWSLGIIVAELLVGRHPFGGLNDVEIANHLAARDIDLSEVTDPRWRSLTAGLLTRDAAHRWGAAEVRSWLGGGEPEVWRPAAARDPYVFCGESFASTRELLAAMSGDWESAAGIVSGVNTWRQLCIWLIASAPGDSGVAALLDDLDGVQQADERLFRLLRGLQPDLGAVFCGFPLSGDGVTALARDAVRQGPDGEAGRAVEALFETSCLRHLDAGGRELDRRWHDDWGVVLSEVQRHTEVTDEERAVARARLLLALSDVSEQRTLRDRSASARQDSAVGVGWFRLLAQRGLQSDTAALATVILLESARTEIREAKAEEQAQADSERRRRLSSTLRRYPRTRTMLGWTLVVMTILSIATVAGRFVTVPAAGWYRPAADGSTSATEAVLASNVLADAIVDVPWLEGWVRLLVHPVVPCLITLVGMVLFVRARGVRPSGSGAVRTEWERRGMQAVIVASCLYFPPLAVPALVSTFLANRAEGAGGRPNRGRRRLLVVASVGFLTYAAAILVGRTRWLRDLMWEFPNWYQEFLAEVPEGFLAPRTRAQELGWLGWLSLVLAVVSFVLATRTYGERQDVEVKAGWLLVPLGIVALVPGALLVLFYPVFGVAVGAAVVAGVLLGLAILVFVLGVMLSGSS